MAITGTEWLIVGLIVFLAIMFKPNALSNLARSLGQAVNEFKKARGGSKPTQEEQILLNTAERLGISTEGKTPGKLGQEILARAARDQH